MPATRNSTSELDLSRASPITNNAIAPNNLSNDRGSALLGTGVGVGKAKRQPLKRSGSGSNSGTGQSLLAFSSRKAGPVTPEKKKTAGAGLKRRIGEVVDVDTEAQQQEDDGGANGSKRTVMMHPVFAAPGRPTNTTASFIEEKPSTSVPLDNSTAVQGISGVPQDGKWDPLLLSLSASGKPTKEMEDNLAPPSLRNTADLEPSLEEQGEESVDDQEQGTAQPRTRMINGLAVRKAMLRADEKIQLLRLQKPTSATSTTTMKPKTGSAGKAKTGAKSAKEKKQKQEGMLDPGDKRWKGVYEAAWELMGGADITPSTLARWERASQWGLEPPIEIREILETVEGANDAGYRETVFDGTGIYCPTA
ncbi:hypothetical protein QFC22_004541 [Naganishia vaughanmartiniae]|uniref:Uncharacterized protein n=1 Tax=Naganishia vaughanmartiniae TaxID=1424756 RepID=A0ACC2X0D2_9TREE|nr:hypothetical protein QFC22_004541 [Naganishia vaughanmartiniae]